MTPRILAAVLLLVAPVPGATTPAGVSPPAATAISLPAAPLDGVALDYLAMDRGRHRVWVPAGGTGAVIVIDTKTAAVRRIPGFPVAEVERNGKKRVVGPSSATIGGKFVYVGDRADASVCAVDAKSLERRGCVTLSSMPDGLAYVASRKEVWVTAPREQAILILDVSIPSAPKMAGRIALEGDPEGYAVDDAHGVFYTNFEDKDRTVRIALATRAITATWEPDCGEEGPRGLVLGTGGRTLVVACPDHLVSLAAGSDGRILSKLPTGAGVDDLDYLPSRHAVYAAGAADAVLTVATLDEEGVLHAAASIPTAKGARNAVATDDGVAYVACGPEGKILVVPVPTGAPTPR
jgi:DNA-binding beta-propeller fold protein YncE